jgi:hypothetical protein
MVAQPDAHDRGTNYLQFVQRLASDPTMIDVLENLRDRQMICTWIGQQIDGVNAQLKQHLEACHACFYPQVRRRIEIFAAPLSQSSGLDGFCNIWLQPTSILIDVGRAAPADWLGLVVHEYAHAHLGCPGHDQHFCAVLSHLCLGLGFKPPLWNAAQQPRLQNWPYHPATVDPLAFWRGEIG